MRYPYVLFDLDGTLIDSVGDIAAALNKARAEFGHPPHPITLVRRFVGDGVHKLIERAFEQPAEREQALASYLAHYAAHMADLTRPYPGVPETLAALHAAGCRMGVVTNKPGSSAVALLKALHLAPYLPVVVGGDNPLGLKPDPAPLRFALGELGWASGEALMVGDGPADGESARNAGLAFCYVSYGLGDPATLRALQPRHEVSDFAALRQVIL
ncbi:MAG: HAD-IA family hydrolase [Planctomycetes bacterium]|nr:HAD-IA family hydrolase [Planctomycetota bacterium]